MRLAGWLLLSGCWREGGQLDQAVWSHDDQALLVAELSFRERGSFGAGTTSKKDFGYQLVLADTSGGSRVPVGEPVDGQNAAEIYAMQGWALSARFDEDGLAWPVHTDLTTGAHTELPPMSEGGPGFAVPSPSGLHIARIAADGRLVEVLASETLRLTGVATLSPTQPVDWTWSPDGRFVVTDGSEAWAVEPEGGEVSPTDPPACVTPKTSSSPIAADGRVVRIDVAGEVRVEPGDPALAFGCQLLAD